MAAIAVNPNGVAASAVPAWPDDETRTLREELQLAGELDELREDADRLRTQLAKAHQLLRTIKRIEPKAVKCQGADDDPVACLVLSQNAALSEIRMRIELYLATASTVLEVRP